MDKEEYTQIIIYQLLEKLSMNRNLLNSKGLIILKRLSSVLPLRKVYIIFADELVKMKDFEFISSMLNILDIFLITYKETESVRQSLRNYHNSKDEEGKNFFKKIFTAWCFNPISTLSLCIISQHFALSYYLILKL